MESMQANNLLTREVSIGSLTGVERLLNDGADVNGKGIDSLSPICRAAFSGRVDIMKLLIDRGADLKATTIERRSDGSFDVRSAPAVHLAIYGRHIDVLQVLLQAGANPNSPDSCGTTPLMAVSYDTIPTATSSEMADALLSAGADLLLESKARKGWKAIHYAAHRGDTLLVSKFLSREPTTVNATTEDGAAPLVVAAHHGHVETVSFLLSAGASDVGAPTTKGVGALFQAANQGHANVVRILLDKGYEAVGGWTSIPPAIGCSIRKDFVSILRMLLNVEGETMLDVWTRARLWFTWPKDTFEYEPVLHAAARFSSYRSAGVLLSAGADELAVNAQGERAGDVIGSFVEEDSSRKEAWDAALRRMLKRGPAFRAQSWVWPMQAEAEATVRIAEGVTRSGQGPARVPVLGMRVFRWKDGSYWHGSFARHAVAGDPPLLGDPSEATGCVRSEEGTDPQEVKIVIVSP